MLLLKKSHYILKELPEWQRGGRNPFILTGAIIYLADRLLAKEFGSKNILTQKIISRSTKIAEYSIRDHYVNLLKPIFLKKG
jgi:transcription initiation factor TFIIIB Brf1 subunit/transcription initiation factor TFIIB